MHLQPSNFFPKSSHLFSQLSVDSFLPILCWKMKLRQQVKFSMMYILCSTCSVHVKQGIHRLCKIKTGSGCTCEQNICVNSSVPYIRLDNTICHCVLQGQCKLLLTNIRILCVVQYQNLLVNVRSSQSSVLRVQLSDSFL